MSTLRLLRTSLFALLLFQSGCSRRPANMPPEYRVVADGLSQNLKPGREDFSARKSTAETLAEMHSATMDLRNVQTADKDIAYLASQEEQITTEGAQRIERLLALPRPPGMEAALEAPAHIFFGDFLGAFRIGEEADAKRDAVLDEMRGLAAWFDKADALSLLLPKIAKKYAAPVAADTGRIRVQLDESWQNLDPYDWGCFYNDGDTLEDCTVVVELRGASGEKRTNVHFVPEWAAHSTLFGRYRPGDDLDGKRVMKTTVTNIRGAAVTVLSPGYSTKIDYDYTASDKDKSVARQCNKIKATGQYQRYEKALIFADTQRGMKVILGDFSYPEKFDVSVSFRRGGEEKCWTWPVDSWKNGEEKTFATRAGELPWDPETVRVALSFPGVGYKPVWDWTIGK